MSDDQHTDSQRRTARPPLRVVLNLTEEAIVQPSLPNNTPTVKGNTFHHNDTLKDAENGVPTRFPLKSASSQRLEKLPTGLQWIPANWNWSKWKPVLRSALAAWIGLLLFLTPTTLNVMGQLAFLIIFASFLSPPSDPFIAVFQRELAILMFATFGWGWSCLGMKLAYIARVNKDPTALPQNILTGQYIEPAPTVIMAVFLFTGSFFFSYVKSRAGLGPLFFACFFGCICIDICITTAVLYPYPYYAVGKFVVLPLTLHSAIALVLSLGLFPISGSDVFTKRLQDVLLSLISATKEHSRSLGEDVTASDFSASPLFVSVGKAESALTILASATRLQKLDIVYSRFAPTDYTQLQALTRGLIVRASGMNLYYTLIDPTREKFPITPAPSTPATPLCTSAPPSRPPSPGHDTDQPLCTDSDKVNNHSPLAGGPTRHRPHYHHSHSHGHIPKGIHHHKRRYLPRTISHQSSNHTHSSILHLALSHAKKKESAVGVFESFHYLNLEATFMSHPDAEAHVAKATELLNASCQDLLKCCEHALFGVSNWLGSVKDSRFNFWMSREEKLRTHVDRVKKYEGLLQELTVTLNEFMTKKRFIVLEPYRTTCNSADDMSTECETRPHRHLFNCYVYQYHLIRFATSIQEMLSETIRLENERKSPKLWFPRIDWSNWVHHTTWEPSELEEQDDDENPDVIPGLDPTSLNLGEAVRRNPDALPPRNAIEKITAWIYHTVRGLVGGNVIFALKAGTLTIALAMPSFLKSSAEFAYKNKFVWAIFMGQFTLARFRGDTTFGLLTRIFSTFVGGIIGTTIWYISAGSGQGNAFGLAAVCFVCFPFFFFVCVYWPVPRMTNLIIWVTSALVFGYSYQDTHIVLASSPGYGYDVAWKRFVLVVVGVTAAGIFSYLPPSTTIRQYQRKTLATTTAEIGTLYCSVISFANTKREGDSAAILQYSLAILNKLKRSLALKKNIAYEGKWPVERYERIIELQMQLSKHLSHLTSVVEQMEPAWAHAFLKRTQLSGGDFQGDVLAVISLISSSLRTGNPLPQVTPCPLLNRFMGGSHGLNGVHEESEEDFGLPKTLTEDTLESLQYLNFCVGVSTTFGIMLRLDKLMVAVKELVGEQYHIDGVCALPLYRHRGRVGMSPAPSIMPGSA